jgi:TrmH family RNA methyltransferase
MPKLRNIHPVLVRPQISANIGAAVRAAKSMGLGPVLLVAPHAAIDKSARALAAGAVRNLAKVRSHAALGETVRDAVRVYGLSARLREHRSPPIWLEEAVTGALAHSSLGPVHFLFGTERTGLENEELDHAHVTVRIKTSGRFRSLNLAQAVMVTAYEIRRQAGARLARPEYQPATAGDLERAVAAMTAALDRRDFFISTKRILAVRRLRDLLGRGVPTVNEIAMLRGMIRSLDEDPIVAEATARLD